MFCIYSICRFCSKLLQNSGNLKYLSTQSFFCARYTSHIEKEFSNPHLLKQQASQATRCSLHVLASKDNHCCCGWDPDRSNVYPTIPFTFTFGLTRKAEKGTYI